MLFDDKRCILSNISGYFFSPLFISKTPKAPKMNTFSLCHSILDSSEECFYG